MLLIVYRLLKNKDFLTINLSLKKAYRETKQHNFISKCYCFLAALALAQANHQYIQKLSTKLIKASNAVGYYIIAQSQFLLGHYPSSLDSVNQYLQFYPYHADANYLKVSILQELNQNALAWQVLEALIPQSTRLKTWLIMANLVNSNQDYQRLLKNHAKAQAMQKAPLQSDAVNEYLALGALRSKNYHDAHQRWHSMLSKASQIAPQQSQNKKNIKKFNTNHAQIALGDLNNALKTKGIEMFLVSGTLLGCVRENKLLGHDKDIDVGVWSETPHDDLLGAIKTCGCFFVQASRSKNIIRIRHVNGIAIDVFYHYKEANTYWHGGVKIKWHNTPFNLINHRFLGQEYLIPDNHEQYLTENYGNWRIPQKDFDSAFDTPNAEIINHHEMAIHAYKMLVKKQSAPTALRYKNYLQANVKQLFCEPQDN